MSVQMPIFNLVNFRVIRKDRLSKRQQKLKRNKLDAFPHNYLIALIFPNLTKSSEDFSSACQASDNVILDQCTSGGTRTVIFGKYEHFDDGPQILCEYLGHNDEDGNFVDDKLNIWPWLPGTCMQFLPRGYRHDTQGKPNCCEFRFKPLKAERKFKQPYECTLPFFYLHRDEAGMFPSSDVLEIIGIPLSIEKTPLNDMIIQEGELYESEKEKFLRDHPDFKPEDFFVTITKKTFHKVDASKNYCSFEDIVAEVISAEKIQAYGINLWKLIVPWISLDNGDEQIIPLTIYTPEINSSGEKCEFSAGDVIYSQTALLGRVLSKDELSKCKLNFFGIR